MTPDRHKQIKEAFLEVLGSDPAERDAVLVRVCGDDESLRREVTRLLSHHHDDTTVLSPAPADSGGGDRSRDDLSLTFQAGDLVNDRFRIVALLGRGGMGSVYRAEDLTLGQPVALKFLDPEYGTDPGWLARFHREARMGREVTHPNVCRIYDIGESGGRIFISMEYVDGEDLSSVIKRIGRLPQERAKEIGRQVCLGLAAAHARGILHRDLKPANIMLDGRGNVRITDFGLARLADDLDDRDARAGTPAYMAPEQFDGTGVGVLTDIYALGLVLFELFAGRAAFESESVVGYARLHRSSSAPRLSEVVADVGPAVEEVVVRCLSKRAEDRPASALSVASALSGGDLLAMAMAAGETPSPQMVAEALPGGTSRSRPLLKLVAGILLLVVLVAARSVRPLSWEQAGVLDESVLVDRAAKVVRAAGYATEGGFAVSGFHRARDLESLVAGFDFAGEASLAVDAGAPSSVVFCYRWAADWRSLDASEVRYGYGRTLLDEKPPVVPGMQTVVLDRFGKLLLFTAVPDVGGGDVGGTSASADSIVGDLVERAGMERSSLVESSSALESVFGLGRRWSWQTTSASSNGTRVVAGAVGEQVVFFGVVEALSDDALEVAVSDDLRMTLIGVSTLLVFVVLFVVSVPLAVSNARGGRSDRVGAFTLAGVLFLVVMTTWLLQAMHVPSLVDETANVFFAAIRSLGAGALAWLFYTALEPLARRYWPHMLITWSRVLRGQLGDGVVGQHVQVGVVVGLGWSLLGLLDRLIVDWLGWTPRPPLVPNGVLDALMGGRMALAGCLDSLVEAMYRGLCFLLLLTLLRRVTGRARLSAVVAVLLLAPMFTPYGAHSGTAWLVVGLGGVGLGVWMMTRYGLLSLITALTVTSIAGTFPMALGSGSPLGDQTLFVVLLLLGLGVYGFVAARRVSV